MRKALTILSVLTVLAACEKSFDISKQVGPGTVWMSFIPSNDYDTTYFMLQATTPLAGVTDPVMTRGESVEVRVNGQPLSLEKGRISFPDRIQSYLTDYRFMPGDVVEAVATVPEAGSVSASCEVPQPFPSYSWSMTMVQRRSTVYTMLVDIEYDGPQDGGYYGAAVIQHSESDSQWENTDPETGEKNWGDVHHSSATHGLSPSPMSDTDGLSAQSEEPVSVSPEYYNTLSGNYYRAQIWHDTPSSGNGRRKKTIALRCYEQPARQDFTGNEYKGWEEYQYTYKLVLYRFSESCYNYLKAKYNDEHNEFAAMGLAPASFVYTNVRGGAGVCGAYTVKESEWTDSPGGSD